MPELTCKKGHRQDKTEDVEHAEHVEIVKFPTPSADPADPVNWAPWRKLALLLVASVYAFTANYISSNIAPALTLWPAVYPKEQKTLPQLVYFIAVGITTHNILDG